MKNFIEKICSKEWQEFINLHKEIRHYEKNEYIFKAGDEAEGLFVINKGKVKITYLQYDGTRRLIRLATEGDILGHRGMGGNMKYPISALVLEKTEAVFIPIKTFNTVVKADSNFAFNMMMFFAEELRHSESKIKHYPVKNLVARAVLDNFKAFGFSENSNDKLSYTLSRKDYASKAGTTYETVVRCLAQMNKDEIIQLDGKTIHILDLNALENLAHPEYLSPK